MAQYVCTVHLYDSHEQVRWTVRVRTYGEMTRRTGEVIYHAEGWFPGSGKDSPAEWVREAFLQINPDL